MDELAAYKLAQGADYRSRVNEKLVKALIALLAVKDEHLLDELCTIFDHAQQQSGELGRAPPGVWAGVNHQIDVLLELASAEDPAEIEQEARH